MNTGHHDDGFDRAMRALHRDAVAHLSPPVRRRLAAARQHRAARVSRSRAGWPVAGALAAVLVLAVALPLRTPDSALPPATVTRTDGAAPLAPVDGPGDAPIEPTALAALEESPEFYLWLASNAAGPAGALQ